MATHSYLPLYRPADTVTFTVDGDTDITAGTPLEVGALDWSVITASAGSDKYVGVAGHNASPGDHVTVEVGKVIHELTAGEAISRGARLTTAADGKVAPVVDGDALFLALSSAAADGAVSAIQL